MIDHFGEDVAATYDADEAAMFTAEAVGPAVDFLAALAGDGPALELGIGTGRIALPLHEAGIAVHGIDLSSAMVDRLRAKPGGDRIPVTIGDFASATAGDGFGLVYLVFNTIGNLRSQDAQVACFENVARHLRPGGRFVIEVGMPSLQQLPADQSACVFDLSSGHVGVDEYDVSTQSLVSHHYYRHGEEWRYASTPMRYVWPGELDLMAQLAGMTLVERWADWDRTPFDRHSRKHISVWQKPTS